MQQFDSTSSFSYTIPWAALAVYMEMLRRAIDGRTSVRLTVAAISSNFTLDDYTSYRLFRRNARKMYGKPNSVSILISHAFSHSMLWAFMPRYTPETLDMTVATSDEIDLAQRLVNVFYAAQNGRQTISCADPAFLYDDASSLPETKQVNPKLVIRLLHTAIPVHAAYIDPVTKAFTVQCTKGFCFSALRGRDIFPHGPALDLSTGVEDDDVWKAYFPTINQDVESWNKERSRAIDTMHQVLLWHA